MESNKRMKFSQEDGVLKINGFSLRKFIKKEIKLSQTELKVLAELSKAFFCYPTNAVNHLAPVFVG